MGNQYYYRAFLGILVVLGLNPNFHNQKPSWTTERSVVDGIETVRIGSFDRNLIPKPWMIDTLFTIGEAYGDDEYLLNRPGWPVTDSDGNIFVGDWGNYRIQKYSADGRWLLTIGRQGSGPGEFQTEIVGLGGLAIWSGNRIAVTDQRQHRLHIFSSISGELEQTKNLYNPNVVGPIHEVDSENVLLRAEVYRDSSRIELVELSSFGPRQTLYSAPLDPWQSTATTSTLWTPYYPTLQWTLLSTGEIAVGTGVPYEIKCLDLDGRTKRHLIVEWVDQRVSNQDKAEVRRNLRESPGGDPTRNERISREMRFPQFKPAFGRLLTDDEGRLWAEHYLTPWDNSTDEYSYDVFNKDLSLLGLVKVPFRADWISNGKIYGCSRGSEGEGIVVICALRGN